MWYSTARDNNMFEHGKLVSCVIIFRKFEDSIKVLLEKKSSDSYAILGGKVEFGETPKQAGVREIKEETNLNIKKKKLKTIKKYFKSNSDGRHCNIYAYLDKSDDEPKPGSDVDVVEWFDIKSLPNILWDGKNHILEAVGKLFSSKDILEDIEPKSEKIIFLDCDGVLNEDPKLHIMMHPEDFDAGKLSKYIYKSKINLINQIIESTGADVVISSSWRNVLSLEDFRQIFKDKGFIGNIVATTEPGGVEHDDRWKQINKCIKELKPKKYIILDDDHLSTKYDFYNPYFVKTKDILGLTSEDVEKSIELLGEDECQNL